MIQEKPGLSNDEFIKKWKEVIPTAEFVPERGVKLSIFMQALDRLEALIGQGQAERDYTPEEALAEARRRWPMFNRMVASVLIQSCFDGTWEYVVRQPLGAQYCGDTFREAFASADKAEAD